MSNIGKTQMNKNVRETVPGDGLRSLRSTMLFRAVNYELYIKPVRLYEKNSIYTLIERKMLL